MRCVSHVYRGSDRNSCNRHFDFDTIRDCGTDVYEDLCACLNFRRPTRCKLRFRGA